MQNILKCNTLRGFSWQLNRENITFPFLKQCLQNVRDDLTAENCSIPPLYLQVWYSLVRAAFSFSLRTCHSIRVSNLNLMLSKNSGFFSNILSQCFGDVCITNVIEWSADHQYQSNLNLTHMMSLHHTLHCIYKNIFH